MRKVNPEFQIEQAKAFHLRDTENEEECKTDRGADNEFISGIIILVPMKPVTIHLKGFIQSLAFRGQPVDLPQYDWKELDINRASPACKVKMPDGSLIALSRWSTPKRTRTYPLARVYDTYSHNGKIVTVIPIVKDEGKGQRRNDTNLDRVNFITLSWMNLMNVYVILAWYEQVEKVDDYRVTNQKFNNTYVRSQLEKIFTYKLDAHHWNRQHFEQDFVPIYEDAIAAYRNISIRLKVQMHSFQSHERFLKRVRSEHDPRRLSLQRFKDLTLRRSGLSATSETMTSHRLESLSIGTSKGLFEMSNNLGGLYYLTSDEVVREPDGRLLIQESKNTAGAVLPSEDDIKDGLFKLLLFSHLSELYVNEASVQFGVRLRLTGNFHGNLDLPCEDAALEDFALRFRAALRTRVLWLNKEVKALGIRAILEGRNAQ